MKNTLWTFGLSILLAGSVIAGTAHDDAADSAYDDGWQHMDNGGYGFGAWVMNAWSNSSAAYFGIGSSTANGGGSNIDTSGESFRIMNSTDTNDYIEVFRYLNSALEAGQTFSFDMDVNWREPAFKGIRLRDDGDVTIFRLEVGEWDGQPSGTWVADVAGVNTQIHTDYHEDTQYHVALEQTSSTGGTWSVTRSGGLSDLDSGSYTGKVSSFQLYSSLASSDAQQDIYFNSFDVSYTPGFDHYAAWTNQYNLSGADAAMDADPDSDTMKNLLEFSLGRDPTFDEGTFRAPEYKGNSSNGLVYVYTRYNHEKAAAMNVDYSLVLTDSLTIPSWETNGFVELPPVFLWGDLVTVTNYVPTTNATKFATLQVEAL
jgi:hypothetical protein